MQHNVKWLTSLLLLTIVIFAACKKPAATNEEANINPPVDISPTPEMPAGSHVAIGPVPGALVTAYYRYGGGIIYTPVIGSFGDNILRSAAAGNPPLAGVTGLAVRNQVGFCLVKAAAAANWAIWTFTLGNPNACTLYSTIAGTAAINLSDLEWDAAGARFLVLNRSALRLTAVPPGAGAVALGAFGNYGALVPNVTGLAVNAGFSYLLGQSGATGYIYRFNAALASASTIPLSTYTPPGVPYPVATEAGVFFDVLLSGRFVVGAAPAAGIANWTLTTPPGGPGAAVAPVWQNTTRIIDFATF
jgi:hypothetical protein